MRAGVHPVLPESCSRIGLRRTSGALTPEKRPQAALTWVNHADLYRIKGVAGQYAELLEAAGVDTVPELAQRNAGNLVEQMETVNERRNLVNRLPNETEVFGWIEEAKTLPRQVNY
jgi:predicted flap endonuclease-1-like 5' DNA nuclease